MSVFRTGHANLVSVKKPRLENKAEERHDAVFSQEQRMEKERLDYESVAKLDIGMSPGLIPGLLGLVLVLTLRLCL